MSKIHLLTLGHNSSLSIIDDDKLIYGVEYERVSGVKSDSRFPQELCDQFSKPDLVYCTHWDPGCRLNNLSEKYWRPSYYHGIPIRTLSPDLTHHDTHAYAALSFAGKDFPQENTLVLVVDGFGNLGEHLSLYSCENKKLKLLKRLRGYSTSLGLWYQYTTAFLGLKMHQDEYKLLGYEAHINEININLDLLEREIDFDVLNWLEKTSKSIYLSPDDPLINLDALMVVKESVFHRLNKLCNTFEINDSSSREGRILCSYYVQKFLELCVLTTLNQYQFNNLIVSGGVFYNVKLNKVLIDIVKGKFCAYPLAGDQGNAIGLFAYDHPKFNFPETLNLGLRKLNYGTSLNNFHPAYKEYAFDLCVRYLDKYGMVNLVRGPMEFGPRALCNTSTLAIPSKSIVEKINKINQRDTIMPMAPVVTRDFYNKNFKNINKVWKSEKYMIVALEYSDVIHSNGGYDGASHHYVYPYKHCTGRPQVIDEDDQFMYRLLNIFGGILINTSFNVHGLPIAYEFDSIQENHILQKERIHTVVMVN